MTPDPFRAIACEQDNAPSDPVAALTDNQKDALRLAHEGLSAGEIAVRLNLRTKSAVNDRIWEARQKLGGISKRDAGRMLAEAEQRAQTAEICEHQADPYLVLPDPQPLWMASRSGPSEQPLAVNNGGELREERAAFTWDLPADISEETRADQHPLLAVMIATLLMLAIVALIKPVSDGFAWLFDAVAPTFSWRRWNDERAIERCGRSDGWRHDGESEGAGQHSPDDRCHLRGESLQRYPAVGR